MKRIISDKNKKSQKIKLFLIKKLRNIKLKSNLYIVIGGDGFMLKTLKKNRNNSKLFYGINSGNYGFLMNKFSPKNTVKNLSKSKMLSTLSNTLKKRGSKLHLMPRQLTKALRITL